MKIILEATLFSSGSVSELVRLLEFASRARHFVEVEPFDDPLIEAWLAEQGERLREECRLFLDISFELSAKRAWARAIRVVERGPSSWSRDEVRLPISEALRHLDQPLRVWLENGRNDRKFLLAIAGPERARELERCEVSGALDFRGGGGLPETLQILKGLSIPDRRSAYVLFDSDALLPGRPSKKSKEVQKHCTRSKIKHHQLRRRTAESYLPIDALDHWTQGKADADLKRKCRALRRLKPEQRFHFNVRFGFERDAKHEDRTSEVDLFFVDVAEADMKTLGTGLGKAVGEAFGAPESALQVWIALDDPTREGEQIADEILDHC